jgi:hypothetical protein
MRRKLGLRFFFFFFFFFFSGVAPGEGGPSMMIMIKRRDSVGQL